MNTILLYNRKENFNSHSPVVLLGAGASLAAFPNRHKTAEGYR